MLRIDPSHRGGVDGPRGKLGALRKKIKDLEFFSRTKNNIFRIVIPPAECGKLIYQLPNKFKYFLDWGGALIWMEACELSEQKFESIKKRVVKHGGYISMIKKFNIGSHYLQNINDTFTSRIYTNVSKC